MQMIHILFVTSMALGLLNETVLLSQKQHEPWTWIYRKTFSEAEQKVYTKKKQLPLLCKYDTPVFSQLLFSWNAQRPQNGFFSFWVQSRNAKTKKWSRWHKMIDWGAQIQRSYSSKDKDSHYEHVRLETEPDLADAFAVKVESHDGADLGLFKSCVINIVNMQRFEPDILDPLTLASLSTIEIKGAPVISQLALEHQRNEEICSPTSCSMLVGFLASRAVDPIDFAQNVFDVGLGPIGHFGSWPFNTAHVFERCTGVFYCFVMRLHSFISLYEILKKQIPVVVSVRGTLEGAIKPYPQGHLLLVIGFDVETQEVIVHDPAALDDSHVYKRYPLDSFLKAWERSRRLAYVTAPIRF